MNKSILCNRNFQTANSEQLNTLEQDLLAIQPPISPLETIINVNPDAVFSTLNASTVTRSELLSHAWFISKQLPEKSHAINLCGNRYLFIVCYLAVILRNQINLLPPNQAKNTINDLLARYQDSYYITDNTDEFIGQRYAIHEKNLEYGVAQPLNFDPNRTVSISFTSGTTGRPKTVHKTWGEFQQSAQLATSRFGLKQKDWTIVSTVPPQHMYGLETSLYWPLFSNVAIANRQPFFPEDIRHAARSSITPCLLISTPTHLKACVRADLNWDNIAMVLSSTAPMDPWLARRIETCFSAPLYEIFGSTETLSFASRRLTANESWQPYQGILVFSEDHDYYIQGGHLRQAHLLDDQLAIDERGFFSITGRASDIVKIAGKRASLAELNRILNQIDGVEDGVFYLGSDERLAALIVGTVPKKTILLELKKYIDDVFLPRPVRLVEELPRNRVGKIIKEKLDGMINVPGTNTQVRMIGK